MFKWYRSIFSVQNPQLYDFLAFLVRMGFLTFICTHSITYLQILSMFPPVRKLAEKQHNNVTEIMEDDLWTGTFCKL